MKLFSYGSNSPEQLAERLGHDVDTQGAYVQNYARAFRGWSRRWGGGVATLIPKGGVTTFGHVTDVSAADLAVLDAREGVPTSYRREYISVVLQNGRPAKAWVYLSNNTTFYEPSRPYLEAVAQTIASHWTGSNGDPITWRDIVVR